jgi:hypothetical protein
MKTFKLKSAFGLNLLVILFFIINGLIFNLILFHIITFVFLMLLPNCSTKN